MLQPGNTGGGEADLESLTQVYSVSLDQLANGGGLTLGGLVQVFNLDSGRRGPSPNSEPQPLCLNPSSQGCEFSHFQPHTLWGLGFVYVLPGATRLSPSDPEVGEHSGTE